MPSLQKMRNQTWKPYRFYQRVVETQTFDVSDEFRNRLPYALASHPKLPLYIASFADLRIKLFMFNHEEPLASFLVNSRRKKTESRSYKVHFRRAAFVECPLRSESACSP